MTIMRAYLGETSNTVIAMLPPEKQKKSTIKYTNFFVTFTMSTLFAALGPGKFTLTTVNEHMHYTCHFFKGSPLSSCNLPAIAPPRAFLSP